MDTHLTVGFRHMRPMAAMVTRAKKKVAELETLVDGRMTNCEIVVAAEENAQNEAYRVGIDVDLAGTHVLVAAEECDPSDDVYGALDNALALITERLKSAPQLPLAAD